MEPVTAILFPILFGIYFYFIFSDSVIPAYNDIVLDPSPFSSPTATRPSVAIVKNNESEFEVFLDE